MQRGEIEVLLLGQGVNPVHALPAGLGFAEAARRVGLVVSLATQPDETTALAHVILPDTHWLEAGGGYAPRGGGAGGVQAGGGGGLRESIPAGRGGGGGGGPGGRPRPGRAACGATSRRRP